MRPILACLLMSLSAAVSADPVKVADSPGTTWYVDPVSIAVGRDVRRVDVVQDYETPDAGGVRSRRVQYEVDCEAERLRSVASADFAQPMAQGSAANAVQRESEWFYVAPQTGTNLPLRSPYRPIVKYVCSR